MGLQECWLAEAEIAEELAEETGWKAVCRARPLGC